MTDDRSSKPRVLLGTITTAHGIRGEVVLRSFTSDPAAIADYGPLSDKQQTRSLTITSARATPKGVIARIAGISDRNAAEALCGLDLYVPRARLPATQENEFYHADLVGLIVRNAKGIDIGRVVAVEDFGAGDLLEMRLDGVKQTEYVPFTNACVPEVNIAGGYAVVVPPEMVGEQEPANPDDGADD